MLRLERILRAIGTLPHGDPTIHDALADALHEVGGYSAECDRLRGVLREACGIVDNAARETMLDLHPSHALAMLTEDEQNRLYALLKGDTE